jgi:hypothetical protein
MPMALSSIPNFEEENAGIAVNVFKYNPTVSTSEITTGVKHQCAELIYQSAKLANENVKMVFLLLVEKNEQNFHYMGVINVEKLINCHANSIVPSRIRRKICLTCLLVFKTKKTYDKHENNCNNLKSSTLLQVHVPVKKRKPRIIKPRQSRKLKVDKLAKRLPKITKRVPKAAKSNKSRKSQCTKTVKEENIARTAAEQIKLHESQKLLYIKALQTWKQGVTSNMSEQKPNIIEQECIVLSSPSTFHGATYHFLDAEKTFDVISPSTALVTEYNLMIYEMDHSDKVQILCAVSNLLDDLTRVCDSFRGMQTTHPIKLYCEFKLRMAANIQIWELDTENMTERQISASELVRKKKYCMFLTISFKGVRCRGNELSPIISVSKIVVPFMRSGASNCD